MIGFFSNIFGYVLNIIYGFVNNYGLAIIIFSILLKLILLPNTIKQQKTMKISQKLQKELKEIQEKYKGNPEKINQETMDLYKREKMSPFSGCFGSIIQLILLLAMFYLVRNPLTYMKKVDAEVINNYKEKIVMEMGENSISTTYPEISIVKYINNKVLNDEKEEIVIDEDKEQGKEISGETEETVTNQNEEIIEESQEEVEIVEAETEEQKEEILNDLVIDKNLYINMNFLGLDLSAIPQENLKDIKVFVIPVLYIISSFISIKLMQVKTKDENNEKKKEENNKENGEQEDMSAQMTKNMTWMMPILAVSVSLIAPLGLALYWLINNILMIFERIFIDKYIIPKEEKENG